MKPDPAFVVYNRTATDPCNIVHLVGWNRFNWDFEMCCRTHVRMRPDDYDGYYEGSSVPPGAVPHVVTCFGCITAPDLRRLL